METKNELIGKKIEFVAIQTGAYGIYHYSSIVKGTATIKASEIYDKGWIFNSPATRYICEDEKTKETILLSAENITKIIE